MILCMNSQAITWSMYRIEENGHRLFENEEVTLMMENAGHRTCRFLPGDLMLT